VSNVLGILGLIGYIVIVIAVAAAITWLVVRLTPPDRKKQKPPAEDETVPA